MSEVASNENLFIEVKETIIAAVPEQCQDCNMVDLIATNSAREVVLGNTSAETAANRVAEQIKENCHVPAAKILGSVSLAHCNLFKDIREDNFKSWY
jgi:hypothetical protein